MAINPAAPGGGAAAQAGDLILVAVNVNGGDTPPGAWTAPSGWIDLGAARSLNLSAGTVLAKVFLGTVSGTGAVTIKNAVAVTGSWAAVWLSGADAASTVTTSARWVRSNDDTSRQQKVVAPATAVGKPSLALCIGWERTTATETAGPTWQGATSALYAPQTGSVIETIAIATQPVAAAGMSADATATYQNAQVLNGIGLQVIVPGVAA
jgi:hypothetical protein